MTKLEEIALGIGPPANPEDVKFFHDQVEKRQSRAAREARAAARRILKRLGL